MHTKPVDSIYHLRRGGVGGGGTRPKCSHLVPPPPGRQVGQTAAGHRSELVPASLAVALLLPPSLSEPGEEQARRHGGDRARRGDFSGPVRQLAAGAPSGGNQRNPDCFSFENVSNKGVQNGRFGSRLCAGVSSDLLPMDGLRCLSLLRLLRDLRRPLETCQRAKTW